MHLRMGLLVVDGVGGGVTGEADGAGALLPKTPRPGADCVAADTDRWSPCFEWG